MKRALLVGINAYPTQPLLGCVDDVVDVAAYLDARGDFAEVRMICDERASKAALVSALGELVDSAASGDSLLFHYSGHGAQVPSADADELDGLDEVLCPYGFDWTPKTYLSDKELVRIVASLRPDARLTCVFDSCHSGGMDRALRMNTRLRAMIPPPDIARMMRTRSRLTRSFRATLAQRLDLLLPACAANETAADTAFDGKPNGAFTYYLLRGLASDGNRSVSQLMAVVSTALSTIGMHPTPTGTTEALQATFTQPPTGALMNTQNGNTTQDDAQLATLIARLSTAPTSRGMSPAAVASGSAPRRLSDFVATLERLADTSVDLRNLLAKTMATIARDSLVAGSGAVPSIDELVALFGKEFLSRGGTVVRAFWWGFHIQISHEDLQNFLGPANSINAIIGAIGGGIPSPAQPFIAAAAAFIAGTLALLGSLDHGNGVYISMTWFAAGIFVPTSV